LGRIEILPQHVINKIAAGEVIERPASVVKELVENSLDAGARRIDVVVEDGGKRLVRVADDGEGISAEDLPLAIRSHATSKLRDPDELFHIRTMGFRGEALASISSVADVTVRSRVRGADSGWEISVSCGEEEPPRVAAARDGTVIEVRNLFRNVPVRRRFLRSATVEIGHAAEAMTRIALAHPEVAFSLRHDDREVLLLDAAESLHGRIEQLFGGELAAALVPVRRSGEGFRLEGFAAPPHFDRSRQDRLYLLLNGRYVRDRTLFHAVHEAYRGFLMTKRYPTAFLSIELDPGDVDVNVHPTKIEVRLRHAGPLYQAILAAVRHGLEQARMTPNVRDPASGPVGPAPRARDERFPEATRPAGAGGRSDPHRAADPAPPARKPERTVREAVGDFLRTYERRPAAHPSPPGEVTEPASPLAPPATPEARRPVQIHRSYILRETEEGFTLTDQHALHERILYHRIRERIAAGRVPVQRLLLPEVVEMSAAETERILERTEDLRKAGFEIVRFGDRSIAVHAVPEFLRRLPAGDWVRQLLLETDEESEGGEKDFRDSIVETAACKGAIKAGDPLTLEEMEDLLRQGSELPSSYSCPHGRPTTVSVSLSDLEKWFRRK
jgi:DNA mismatch repair protein MutL